MGRWLRENRLFPRLDRDPPGKQRGAELHQGSQFGNERSEIRSIGLSRPDWISAQGALEALRQGGKELNT